MKRWRLVSLALGLVLIIVLVGGGIFTAMPATQERGEFWLWLPWVRAARERAVREELIRADREAERALQAEAAKRAEEAAKKKEP